MAFSIALMEVLSKGEMSSVEASGVATPAICLSGVSAP
jgi:hypothetical protein